MNSLQRRPNLAVVALLPLWLACGAPAPSVEAGSEASSIAPEELAARIAAGTAPPVLDVRSRAEFDSGHVPGAVNIPHTELGARLEEVPEGEELVVTCERGGRAAQAEALLRDAGFDGLRHLEGDMSGWRSRELPTER